MAQFPDTGVYMILNKVSGKKYIGSASVSFKARWNLHRSRLNRGVHTNVYLQQAWQKHGELAFEFLILETCAPMDCVKQEQFWIDFHKSAERETGYNLNPMAGSSLGRKLSEEHRNKIGNAHKGMKRTPETCRKIAVAKKGQKASEEARANMSAAARLRKIAGFTRPHSDETKAKMSVAAKGKPKSAAHCEALSLAKIGKKLAPYRLRSDSSSGADWGCEKARQMGCSGRQEVFGNFRDSCRGSSRAQ